MRNTLHVIRAPLALAAVLTLACPLLAGTSDKATPGGEHGAELRQCFRDPPADCWPHTRWWWPGNPVTKEEITWELEQMRGHGIRGVEQITMAPVYERGNIPFMSATFIEMIKHTVTEAKRLGMEVSLNFGGPGWIIGGPWVPEEDRAKDMIPTYTDLVGPRTFKGPLPSTLSKTNRAWEVPQPALSGAEELLAVVAGKVADNRIDPGTLTVLTPHVAHGELEWRVPVGHWRLMAFWLAPNRASPAVDHFNKAAMERYCDYLGGRLYEAVGAEFGRTVDSLFCDSFELPNLASGIYWSTGLFAEFTRCKGYDLKPYLPAIWWDVGALSAKIRYDVNEFLHHVGMQAFFRTFIGWCVAHGVAGRIQPYGFTTDNIAAAGATHIPEMEITPGEKNAAPWFDTRIGPKKYVASGAHIYGRPVISVEAYTFIHWQRYRATLEELKIASDGFLRTGATKFYNVGYSFSPERTLAPSRSLPWAANISPTNVWWKYYPLLAEYIARCSYLLRQGDFVADIAIYSPLANQWTLDVLNPRKWTRGFDWGELGKLLVANGYDFDLLNDDALQNIARVDSGTIRIRALEYKVLILPNIAAIPLPTLAVIQRYVRAGGIVIALERTPESSTGFTDYVHNDAKVTAIVKELFGQPQGRDGTGPKSYGKGRTYHLKHVIDRQQWWDRRRSSLDPFLHTIRQHVAADFGIDFVAADIRQNEGLTFLHRRLEYADVYFVANIQDRASDVPVTFRVQDRRVERWNPYNGNIAPVHCYEEKGLGTTVPLRLAPFESTVLVFWSGPAPDHVEKSDFAAIVRVTGDKVVALAARNGILQTTRRCGANEVRQTTRVTGNPAPFVVAGTWQVVLRGPGFPPWTGTQTSLTSWADEPRTRHFSGTGRYQIDFDLPADYVHDDLLLRLDLGKVGHVAEARLNGRDIGVVWMRGQTLEITDAAAAGHNHLVVLVTNTSSNSVAEFSTPRPIPKVLLPRFGSGTTAYSARIPVEFGFKPLSPSGLMGPVQIKVLKKVAFSL